MHRSADYEQADDTRPLRLGAELSGDASLDSGEPPPPPLRPAGLLQHWSADSEHVPLAMNSALEGNQSPVPAPHWLDDRGRTTIFVYLAGIMERVDEQVVVTRMACRCC